MKISNGTGGKRGHVTAAVKGVRQNKGSPGMDRMTADELLPWLVENWETIRAQVLDPINKRPLCVGRISGRRPGWWVAGCVWSREEAPHR